MHDSSSKPSLLVVSGSYVVEENCKKLIALCQYFKVTCLTATWCHQNSLNIRFERTSRKYSEDLTIHASVPLGNPCSSTKFLLHFPFQVLTKKYDCILVESEPWALLKWQTYLLKFLFWRNALWFEYSAENSLRSGIKKQILDWAYWATEKISDGFICISEDSKKMHESLGFKKEKLLIAPQLGIDLDAFCRVTPEEKFRIRESCLHVKEPLFLFGFFGRLEFEKGMDTLMSAFSLCQKKSKKNIGLLLIGDGGAIAHIRNWSKDHDNVFILPSMKHHELIPYFQSLDAFILPTKTLFSPKKIVKEQLGHVLLEAMACGIPCIGSTCGEIPNIVDDPELIFNEGDPVQLSEKMIQLTVDDFHFDNKKQGIGKNIASRFSNEALSTRLSHFILDKLNQLHLTGNHPTS